MALAKLCGSKTTLLNHWGVPLENIVEVKRIARAKRPSGIVLVVKEHSGTVTGVKEYVETIVEVKRALENIAGVKHLLETIVVLNLSWKLDHGSETVCCRNCA